MDMQMQRGKEHMKALPPKEKLKNFFFYYKWQVIIAVIAVAAIVMTFVECSRQVHEDMAISYFSTTYIDEESVSAMREFFSYDYCIDDINGDGERNLLLSSYAGSDENVTSKYMVEIAAGDSMAFLFDSDYYDLTMRNQPDSIDCAVDITQNAELKELFGLGDEPLYFAVKSIYASEEGDEERERMHDNAMKLYKIIIGDDATAAYFSTTDIDDDFAKTLEERFGEYAQSINDSEEIIVGISLIEETDTDALAEHSDILTDGTVAAFVTDAAFYEAFETLYPDVIERSLDISAAFDLEDGSLYYIVRRLTGEEDNLQKTVLLYDNAVRIMEGLRNN